MVYLAIRCFFIPGNGELNEIDQSAAKAARAIGVTTPTSYDGSKGPTAGGYLLHGELIGMGGFGGGLLVVRRIVNIALNRVRGSRIISKAAYMSCAGGCGMEIRDDDCPIRFGRRRLRWWRSSVKQMSPAKAEG